MTLNLPAHRLERLREVLQWIQPPRKRLAASKWHKLLGELQSMSPALPGTRGLFSVLQSALSRGDGHRVRLNQRVYDVAADFTDLVDALASRPTRLQELVPTPSSDALASRPTRLQELVPTPPSHVGAADACRLGMGGVWLDATGHAAPIVWRHPFPSRVAADLVTTAHPRGSISISDLELTALIAQKDILARSTDVREHTLWLASDNRAAVSWSQKGSSTSTTARAYLLQFNALHQRKYRYLARHHYIPGPVNAMADAASWRWDLSDDALLTYFDSHYPQARSWQLHHLNSATNASVIGALSRKRPRDGYLVANVAAPLMPPGLSGKPPFAKVCTSLLPSLFAPVTTSHSSNSFGQRYRAGTVAPGRHTVRSRTVEDAVRAVGQAYARMGTPDPRLNSHGKVDMRLTSLYRAWKRDDEPPKRVKSLPLTVVSQVYSAAQHESTASALAAADCLVLGFYFLLCPGPGEYLGVPPQGLPGPLFRLGDVQF